MKKSVYLPILILLFTFSASFVIAKNYIEPSSKTTVSIKTITRDTTCVVSRKVIILPKGLFVYARSHWNFKTYLPQYKCFVPSYSIK